MKIAFVSCVNFARFQNQPQWLDITNQNPDYLFLLGDNIYMDYFYLIGNKEPLGKPKEYSKEQFEEIMEKKYRDQWNEPHFKPLCQKMGDKVFGIWDDHDFAWNNAWGNEVKQEIKDISRAQFHKWMNCSTNLPEVYYHLDIEKARVIFLDNRYYADSPKLSNAKMLGDKQFDFLAEKLNHDRQYTIICAGLTLTHSKSNWSKFTGEYDRFCKLVEMKKNILFLAGDIHKNKFGAPSQAGLFRPRRPCYEIVSSGLATDYIGLPFKFDNTRNWGLLELNENEVLVQLFNKNGRQSYRIDSKTWQYTTV